MLNVLAREQYLTFSCDGFVFATPTEDGGSAPADSGAAGGSELAEENQVLREENNMLKLKVSRYIDQRPCPLCSHNQNCDCRRWNGDWSRSALEWRLESVVCV